MFAYLNNKWFWEESSAWHVQEVTVFEYAVTDQPVEMDFDGAWILMVPLPESYQSLSHCIGNVQDPSERDERKYYGVVYIFMF